MLKFDLIKYYLAYSIKSKNKDKVLEFFSNYSHEILSDTNLQLSNGMRQWFILPYLEDPEKDPEFSLYFSTRWAELMKITLHNFLSVVISSAPPPKILVLEKWFRNDSQQELRNQLKIQTKRNEILINKFENLTEHVNDLREIVKTLINQLSDILKKEDISSSSSSTITSSSTTNNNNNNNITNITSTTIEDSSLTIIKLLTDCNRQNTMLKNLPRDERIKFLLGSSYFSDITETNMFPYKEDPSNKWNNMNNNNNMNVIGIEEIDNELIEKIKEWMKLINTMKSI